MTKHNNLTSETNKMKNYRSNLKFWGAVTSISLCMLLLVWAVFISGSRADISNFASYSLYNNLSQEDTQSGPYSNTVVGTYTFHQMVLVKYSINRRISPSGTNWSDTLAVDAVSGDTIEFRITWQDSATGGPADTMVLIDAVPAGMTFIDSSIASGGGILSYSSPVFSWRKNNVTAGETGDIRFRARTN